MNKIGGSGRVWIMSFKIIILCILCIFVAFVLPIYSQNINYQSIDDTLFKKIKISRFKFMFRAIQKESVSEHGIVKSLLYVQIQGYLVSFGLLIYFIYRLILKDFYLLDLTIFIITISHIISIIIITLITGLISNKREKKKILSPVEILNKQLIIDLLKADNIINKKKREEEIQRIYTKHSEELIKYYKEIEEMKKDDFK